MRVVFLGPPGAGKGTQAEAVCKSLAVAHVSTGDILRKALADGAELGLKAKEYMDSGGLVPDDVVVELVADRLAADDMANGYVLDGFPRTISQAKSLDSALAETDDKLDVVVYFETSEDTIIHRLTGRRVCRECGAIYHVSSMKPKTEGACDKCGGELYQRDDDKLDTIKERVRVYNEATSDLIDYYRKEDILSKVSGDSGVEELRGTLLDLINKRVG
jgi:adenylate kinase